MKSHKIILFILFIALCSCVNDKLTGKYQAFWYETYWEIQLKRGNNFKFSTDGHFGNISIKGTYIVYHDTLQLLPDETNDIGLPSLFLVSKDDCLIDLDTKFDFCKYRPDEWASSKREIFYPQVPTQNNQLKKEVEKMLQIALNSNEIPENITDTTRNLIFQEYYEINRNANFNLTRYGKPVIFKSEEEIKSENIKEYLVVNEFNIGIENTLVWIYIQTPNAGYASVLEQFKKSGESWIHKKRN